jgi:DNA (cytosine-5)-methyltransferase 1
MGGMGCASDARPFRYLSVCSGIEAASVAWKPLGWECAGLAEIDPFPRAVLQHRLGATPVDLEHRYHPDQTFNPLFGDFTKIEAHHVGPVDLLVGGTPCQSFSVAGKRLGLDDPRGHLTLEFLALARRVRARWIVWENVPGILSHDGGRTFGTFLGLLGQCGFRWAYRVLDAQYVRVGRFRRAVPQRRRRVFVVGYSGAAPIHPRAVLFDRESLCWHPAPRREAGQRPAPTLAARTRGGGGLGIDFDCDGGLIAARMAAFGEHADDGTASEMKTRDYKDATDLIAYPCEGWHGDAPDAIAIQDVRAVEKAQNGKGWNDDGASYTVDALGTQGVAHTLRSEGFDASEDGTGRGTPVVAFAQNTRDEVRLFNGDGTIVGALSAEPESKQTSYVASAWRVRRLTPTEVARLQGFPDDWARIPWRGKPAEQCPDGPQYRAYGNSMAVNVMCWIGERIEAVRQIEPDSSPSPLPE